MADAFERKPIDQWGGESVELGQTKNLRIQTSESYIGTSVRIPIQVQRGPRPGPTVFVTAALHGDEINGTGAIRHLIHHEPVTLTRGSIIWVPVVNLPAFERHSRYLPDRRDLNRSFPGSSQGSMASRMAASIFSEIVMRSDVGIDLHTAAVRRTNYPNVRANMSDPTTAAIAEAFGAELIIDNQGPESCFRREACRAGCPTIVVEGGEVWKVEPGIVQIFAQGILNVLGHLEMTEVKSSVSSTQTVLSNTKWVRAERGGFLQFHVRPGELVEAGQPIATNNSLLGIEKSALVAPFGGVIIGMTTLPAVAPGEPVCHIGKLSKKTNRSLARNRASSGGSEERLIDELSTNVLVVDKTPGESE